MGDDRPPAVTAPGRDPHAFAPLFVLSPARSNSTIAAGMIGMHPQLCGFPELGLFRRPTVGELLSDPPGWRGAPASKRIAGLLRALAQHHDGEQTAATIAAALAWLDGRRDWSGAAIYDHLLDCCTPRVGVEKSPEHVGTDAPLARIDAAYPCARYIHLVRHPASTVRSMHRHWQARGRWTVPPELFHQFCLGVWYFQHERIARFLSATAQERTLVVRSEDLLREPDPQLRRICAWLRIDDRPAAIDAMRHPERSPYARLGPAEALGGGDSGFLSDPVLRAAELPGPLDLPAGWRVDPWQLVAALELAGRFGYAPATSRRRSGFAVSPTR